MSESGQEEMADPLQARGQVRLRSVIFFSFFFFYVAPVHPLFGARSLPGSRGGQEKKLRLA